MKRQPHHPSSPPFTSRLWHWLGSLPLAVTLIVALATVLAFATRYESLYNTPAAQRVFYHAWWFQALLGLLAVNLTISALHRWPWKPHHVGFLLTHLGIICILLGGLIGTWRGAEGQLLITEGQTEHLMHGGEDQITLRAHEPDRHFVYPVSFASHALEQAPHFAAQATVGGRPVTLTVDRYYSNARVEERVATDGEQENPAIELAVAAAPSSEQLWLFARDPDRFGLRWGDVHLFFMEPATPEELARLLKPPVAPPPDYRGVLHLEFPDLHVTRDLALKEPFGEPIAMRGTPYTVTIKDYLPDFAITEQGVQSRSKEPNNPALAFLVSDKQGSEPHLVFALHPEFEELHKHASRIQVRATYRFDVAPPLPPALIGIVKGQGDQWHVVMTSSDGSERKAMPLLIGQEYTHPWLHYTFRLVQYAPRARLIQDVKPVDHDVRNQAIHVRLERVPSTGNVQQADAWVFYGNDASLVLGDETLTVSYGSTRVPVPFDVKLLAFRKQTYPGLDMAQSFESDVELHDAAGGITLKRTISMNNPLTWRGYKIFQSGYQDGPPKLSIFSVRKDPGVPLVYTGFIVVVLGIALMFYWKPVARKDRA